MKFLQVQIVNSGFLTPEGGMKFLQVQIVYSGFLTAEAAVM